MLAVEVFPGRSVGPFFLGISISEAIQFIQQKYKIISHANLIYNETEPLGSDIILDLNEDGMRLKFEPSSQKLRVMEVYDLSKVTLSYAGMVFCSPEKVPSLVCISDVFGPTHPGEFDSTDSVYSLHYPGLSFSFPIPDKYRSLYADTANGIPPMEFPDGITPVASRLYLYIGSIKNPQLPLPQTNSLYFEKIAVRLEEGITFTWRDEKLNFTSSTQDVLSILGPPTRVFFKEEDKMKIHTVSYTGLGCADYFYNYFSHGIDVLFDIDSHLVKKFILHTNFPNHHTFNQYVKCNFYIEVNNFVITADSKWSDVQQVMGPCGKPVIHHRGSNSSPFGPTLSYGYQNIIFEESSIVQMCLT